MTSEGANLVDKTLRIIPHSKQGEDEYVKKMEIVYIEWNSTQTLCCTEYTIETWSFLHKEKKIFSWPYSSVNWELIWKV